MQSIKDWVAKKTTEGDKPTNFPPITGSLRKLTVCAASTLLERFDRTMATVDRNSLVGDMTVLRNRGFNSNHFAEMVHRKGDPDLVTGKDKLTFLTFGSPALRFIFHQLHTYVLPQSSQEKPQKLLLTENVPLTAQFWELCCNSVYVESAVLHAALSDAERIQLVARFNNADDPLLVLIIMHAVSSQGVNLDRCCRRVIVVTNAPNAPLEWQSWGRVIRV